MSRESELQTKSLVSAILPTQLHFNLKYENSKTKQQALLEEGLLST